MCANPIFSEYKVYNLQEEKAFMTFGVGLLVFIKDKHIEISKISINKMKGKPNKERNSIVA